MALAVLMPLLLLAATAPGAGAEGFLGRPRAGRSTVSLRMRSEELQAALGAVLGCGGGGAAAADGAALAASAAAKEALLPIWGALPKNQYGRVEWKLLRYMAHRHFMRRFSVVVRGLEPTRQVNASHAGEAEILSQQVPALARQLLSGPRAEHGFSLEDAAAMVAALEQLVFDSEGELLETVYHGRELAPHQTLGREELQAVLKDFMVRWMLGDDEEGADALLKDPALLIDSIPHWHAISEMVEGSVQALEYSRQRAPQPGGAHIAFEGKHTFEDALQLVGSIGRRFAGYWEPQCQDIKASLVELDTAATGRVRLSDFYGANLGGEWRFGESEAYLRELGALDESSPWRGKQVIIPNYLQGASNCIVSRPHYLVCCASECEDILGQVEAAVGAAVARPEDVLQVVGNMTSDDDEPVPLDEALRRQLRRVAETHGGKVPLHGRLFAQWLHYVFPRECPFPHKAGAVAAVTPAQFGEQYVASMEEVNKHIAEQKVKEDLAGVLGESRNASGEALQRMTQWSEDEELPGDYSTQLRAPWERGHLLAAGGAAAVAAAAALWAGATKAGRGALGAAGAIAGRSHSV